MCFTKVSRGQEAKIAKTDIHCFKLLVYNKRSGKYDSPFYYTEYSTLPGATKTVKNFTYSRDWDKHRVRVEKGLHSYKTKKEAIYWKIGGESIHEFIIPKGTRYFENSYEYVSLKLKYVGKPK